MVTIKFASDMYVYAPNEEPTVELALTSPQTLQEILRTIGLTGEEIGFILHNKKMLNINQDLQILIVDQDVIELYPFIGGG